MTRRKMDHEALGVFCRCLGQMYHAGIGAGDAFALMAEDAASAADRELLQEMVRLADGGLSAARIFHKTEAFPPYLCSLMLVGERVGRSEDTLNALADYYDRRAALERQVKHTLLYPLMLLAVLLAVIFVLLVWVLPVFDEVYARLGSGLTGVAGGLLSLGVLLRRCMPVLGVLAALLVCFAVAVSAAPALRERGLAAWRAVCGGRGVGRQIGTARFLQALAMGVCGGLTEREAAALAAELAGSRAMQERCAACLNLLDGGANLSAALRETELLSAAQCRLLETGTRAGNGAQVLEQIACKAMEESEDALERVAGRIEPAVVMVMSLLVGAILLSVMLPLMHIMTAIG